MPLAGDSAALRRAINAQHQQSTGQKPYPDQAHHLLCSNVIVKLERQYSDLAFKAGYQLNGANNGLLMPAKYGHQMHPYLQRHCGGHSKKHYADVRQVVESIYKDYQNKGICDAKSKEASNMLADLKDCEDIVRDLVKKVDWELYASSRKLFDGDYRDEGIILSLPFAPPVIAKASGLYWLETKFPGGVRRRHLDVNGQAVLYPLFYTREGYPVPGSETD